MANEELKEKTVQTALAMFVAHGLRGVTMDDIAQAMHCSKRTLYEQFGCKEELLEACIASIHKQTNELHVRAHSKVAEPMLMAMYMLHSNSLFVQKYNRLIEECERYYPEIHDRFFMIHSQSLREALRKGMDHAAEHGYLREDADPEVAIDFFCRIIRYKRLSEVDDAEAYSKWLNEICFTYLRGLMNTETLKRYDNEKITYEQILSSIK